MKYKINKFRILQKMIFRFILKLVSFDNQNEANL